MTRPQARRHHPPIAVLATALLAMSLAACSSSGKTNPATAASSSSLTPTSTSASATAAPTGAPAATANNALPAAGATALCPEGPDPESVNPSARPVVIINAQRRNSSTDPSLPKAVCTVIIAAAKGHAAISVVILDGRPIRTRPAVFSTKAANGGAQALALKIFIQGVEKGVLAVAATQPHVNLTQALTLGAAKIHDGSKSAAGDLFVLGSALQETGVPDFASPGMLDAAPKEVAALMTSKRLIPDLTNISVFFIGSTYTAAPQQPLDGGRSQNVQNIWAQIVTTGHGTPNFDIEPTQVTNSVPDADKLPSVALVPIPPPVVWKANQIYEDGGPLGYQPDVAVLLHEEDAKKALAPAPAWLRANPTCQLKITGTTARVGDMAGQVKLGLQRAETAKAIIVGLGGDGSRIITEGVGSDFEGYVVDHDADGNLLPDKAQQNRTVRFAPDCDGQS